MSQFYIILSAKQFNCFRFIMELELQILFASKQADFNVLYTFEHYFKTPTD